MANAPTHSLSCWCIAEQPAIFTVKIKQSYCRVGYYHYQSRTKRVAKLVSEPGTSQQNYV